MSGTGAVIDAVGADRRAHEFLQDIVLFIGATGRTERRQCIRTMFRFYFVESIGYQTQRFIPGSRLQFFVLADQRRCQTLRAVNIINAEPAFDAEQAAVDRAVWRRSDANHFAIFDIQVKITTNATERTGRSHFFVRLP